MALGITLDELAGRCVVLELQWALDGDDDSLTWVLDLYAIVDAPGPTHSAFRAQRLDRFPATTLEEREHAHASGRRLADNLGVPFEAPDVTDHGGTGGSRWLERAAAGGLYGYPIRWTARWWTDVADRREASGRDTMYATSGKAAARQVAREVAARTVGRALYVLAEGDDTHESHHEHETYPADAISIAQVRALATSPSSLVKVLDLATPFDLMIVFSEAFYLTYEVLVSLATWYVDRDDAALDAALGPKLADTRYAWDRPRRLREAFAAGKSIAALLRDERTHDRVRAFVDLRDLFDLSFSDAKDFISSFEDARNDARLDAMLRLR